MGCSLETSRQFTWFDSSSGSTSQLGYIPLAKIIIRISFGNQSIVDCFKGHNSEITTEQIRKGR